MGNRWTMLAVLVVVRIAMGFQFQSVAAVGQFLIRDLDLSNAQMGTLAGLYLMPGAFMAIPLGLFGSRFGDKKMIALGVALMVCGGVVTGFADGFVSLALGRGLAGIGGVLQGIFVVKALSDWFEGREVATAMGIMLSGWPVGIALALLVLGPVAIVAGWSATMFLAAGFCALSLIVLLLLFRAAPAATQTHSGLAMYPPVGEMLLVLAGSAIWTIYNVAYIAFLTFGPALFIEQGLSMIEAGLAVSISSWASMIAVPLGGYLADRLRRPGLVVAVGCFVATACCIAMPNIQAPILLSIILGLAAAAPAGVLMATVTGVMQPRFRALGNGIYYTVFYGGMGLAPALAGLAADQAGTASAPIYLAASVVFVTVPLFALFTRWSRRSAPLTSLAT